MSICDSCGQAVEELEWDPCAVREGAGSLEHLIFGDVLQAGLYAIHPTARPEDDEDAWTVSHGLSEIGRYPSVSACRWAAESHHHAEECPHATPLISRKPWWKSFFT